jgi:hypothetical protein
MPFAIDFESSRKLYNAGRIVWPTLFDCLYAEPQPTLLFIESYSAGACCRMPRRQQIGFITIYKSTVTRAHQLLGRFRNCLSTKEASAALRIFDVASTGADNWIIEGCSSNHRGQAIMGGERSTANLTVYATQSTNIDYSIVSRCYSAT